LTTSTSHLIAAHGGVLLDLLVSREQSAEYKAHSRDWPSWNLTARQLCDLELLLNGGFSPLRGFMTRADYEGVCHNMRLAGGTFWPMPITLDVTEDFAGRLKPGSKVALRDPEGVMLAVLDAEDVWQPDRTEEAGSVFGTTSKIHPGVDYLLHKAHPCYVGGKLSGLQLPAHYDFRALRFTPADASEITKNRGIAICAPIAPYDVVPSPGAPLQLPDQDSCRPVPLAQRHGAAQSGGGARSGQHSGSSRRGRASHPFTHALWRRR